MKKIVITVMLLIAAGGAHSADDDQLLPSNEANRVQMKLSVDGKAVRAVIKNNSTMTITSGKLTCTLYDQSKPRPRLSPKGNEWCEAGGNVDAYLAQQSRLIGKKCDWDSPYGFSFEASIVPGASSKQYFEAYQGRLPPATCALEDLRGRERRFWER